MAEKEDGEAPEGDEEGRAEDHRKEEGRYRRRERRLALDELSRISAELGLYEWQKEPER